MKIHQEINFENSSQEIFKALTVSKEFAEFTGSAAVINNETGGVFTCFDGMISGITLEVETDKIIVQAWRAANWDPGVYSVIKIELEETANNQTKLIFDHTGFPEDQASHLEQGWHDRYWEPLRVYLSS